MNIKITRYDFERNVFECYCTNHPEWDRFDPFVSGITNGDEYLELNKNMVGKTIDVDVFNHGRTLLLKSGDGEENYKQLVRDVDTQSEEDKT